MQPNKPENLGRMIELGKECELLLVSRNNLASEAQLASGLAHRDSVRKQFQLVEFKLERMQKDLRDLCDESFPYVFDHYAESIRSNTW